VNYCRGCCVNRCSSASILEAKSYCCSDKSDWMSLIRSPFYLLVDSAICTICYRSISWSLTLRPLSLKLADGCWLVAGSEAMRCSCSSCAVFRSCNSACIFLKLSKEHLSAHSDFSEICASCRSSRVARLASSVFVSSLAERSC